MKGSRFRLALLAGLGTALLTSGAVAQTTVESFEFASSTANAQAGTTVYQGTLATGSADSGSGANANEGTYALGVNIDFNGAAFDNINVERFLSAPYVLTTPIAAGDLATDFAVRLDIKGDPAFAAGANGTNIWVRLFDADGDQFQFINFTDAALGNSTYTADHPIAFFNNSVVVNGTLEQVTAVQIVFQDADGDDTAPATVYLDKLVFEEVTTPLGPHVIDDFELAVDDTAAQTLWGGSSDPTVLLTRVSGSGANANEGSFSLGMDLQMFGAAFEQGNITRILPVPVALDAVYNTTNASPLNVSDLAPTIDLKGLAGNLDNCNIWLRFNETDGDQWQYINFLDPAIGGTSFADDHQVFFFSHSITAGDGNFTEIASYEVLIQNPEPIAKNDILHIDDLKIAEPGSGGPPPPPLLVYNIPLITPAQAPNVTDTVFDPIYSNAGAHDVIEGDEWKDWAQRNTDPGAGISTNADPVAAAGIFGTSKAYLLSDGTNLYFGMRVWDPNTANMTADTGDETLTKFEVEDIEVAFSALQGNPGSLDAAKIVMDAFSNIDDMIPDGNLSSNTGALTNNNSYIIDANTWAVEWSVPIADLTSGPLANPLPPAGPWYGHIGYQSPFPGPRVPLYAAAHGNGFGLFNVQFNLPTTPGVIPGDVNNDGTVNVADVTDLENYLATLTGAPAGDADVNNDMVIDGSDSLYLTNYLVGNGPTPP